MKKAFIFAVMVVAVALTACQKDDNPVDMLRLVGSWNRTGVVGSGLSYTFDGDGRYIRSGINIINPNVPGGIHQSEDGGRYEVSTRDSKIIRLIEDGSDSVKEYFLLELNSKEMRWRDDAGKETTFARVTD